MKKTSREALEKSYAELSPFSDTQKWEFDNNLVHLNYIQKHITRGVKVADFGCGIGILDLALLYLGYNITGYDKYVFADNGSFSVKDIMKLKSLWEKHNLSINFVDIGSDSDKNSSDYDAVLSVAAIEHQILPRSFIESMRRSLRPGGVAYIATPNVAHLLNRIRFIFGFSVLPNIREFYNDSQNFLGHIREYTLSELVIMFEMSGLEIIEANTLQSMKPKLKFNKPRDLYVNFFRLISCLVPNLGDTNIIVGRKPSYLQ